MEVTLFLMILVTLEDLAKCEKGCLDEDECVTQDTLDMDSDLDDIYNMLAVLSSGDDEDGSGALDSSICGENSTYVNTVGSYYCQCDPGFTNYNFNQGLCVEIHCDVYESGQQTGSELQSLLLLVRQNCLLQANSGGVRKNITGEELLQGLVNTTDVVQSRDHHGSTVESTEFLTGLLSSVEDVVRLIGPQLSENSTRIESRHTDAQFLVHRDRTPPSGPVRLTTDNAQLDTNWETVIGHHVNLPYPGFAFVVIVSYKNLTLPDEHVPSNVVTVAISNPHASHLVQPINITFTHLGHGNSHHRHVCVFWAEEEGTWSKHGCNTVGLNSSHTLCTCQHLSSFALIRRIHQNKSGGHMRTVVTACVVAMMCVAISVLSTMWCRYVSNKRNRRRYTVQ